MNALSDETEPFLFGIPMTDPFPALGFLGPAGSGGRLRPGRRVVTESAVMEGLRSSGWKPAGRFWVGLTHWGVGSSECDLERRPYAGNADEEAVACSDAVGALV